MNTIKKNDKTRCFMNIWLHLGNQVMVHKTEYNFQRLKAKAEVWNRVWILEASSKNGCKKSPF